MLTRKEALQRTQTLPQVRGGPKFPLIQLGKLTIASNHFLHEVVPFPKSHHITLRHLTQELNCFIKLNLQDILYVCLLAAFPNKDKIFYLTLLISIPFHNQALGRSASKDSDFTTS